MTDIKDALTEVYNLSSSNYVTIEDGTQIRRYADSVCYKYMKWKDDKFLEWYDMKDGIKLFNQNTVSTKDQKLPYYDEYVEICNVHEDSDYDIIRSYDLVENGCFIRRFYNITYGVDHDIFELHCHSGEPTRIKNGTFFRFGKQLEYLKLSEKTYLRHEFANLKRSDTKKKIDDYQKIRLKEESEYLHNQLQKIDKNETELLSEVQEAIYRINPEERPKEKKGLMQTIFGSGSKIEALLVKLQDLSLETDPNNDFSLLTHTNGFHSSESSDS